MAIWEEEGSRGLAHVAMLDFPTVADAIFEIMDNPLDYRRGRPLHIDISIDRAHDRILIEDRGGEGMDAEGIADWLKWGTGHPHETGDIGRYHKGGKAACGYLADSVAILTRRAGQRAVWRFEDKQWKGRTEWATFGEPAPWPGNVPDHLRAVDTEVGFTRFELTNLVANLRYNVDTLIWKIGNTYRKLISDGALTVSVDGRPVRALKLPLSAAFVKRVKTLNLPSGRRLRVWVGRLDRDGIRSGQHRIYGGMRLLFQKRLISEGEYFGHLAEGKGLLASLIGEVEINHAPPLSNKTGFRRDIAEWVETEEAMHNFLGPIIAEFRKAAEEHPVSREEKKRANEVRRQLTDALRQLRTTADDGGKHVEADTGPDGRRPPTEKQQRDERVKPPRPRERRRHPRTEAPADAVGTLQRLRRRLRGGDQVPPIELREQDPSVRSEALREPDGTVTKIIINTRFPVYHELGGHEAYLAETALLELLLPAPAETTPVASFLGDVNQALDAWHRVAKSAGAAAA